MVHEGYSWLFLVGSSTNRLTKQTSRAGRCQSNKASWTPLIPGCPPPQPSAFQLALFLPLLVYLLSLARLSNFWHFTLLTLLSLHSIELNSAMVA